MTLSQFMKRRDMSARPHGFRSSLRVWIAETTDTPHDVAETVLTHKVGGKVERSYRRTDYLERRRVLMERWGELCTATNAEVVPFETKKKSLEG